MGERRHRVGEEHHAESTDHQVVGGIREGMDLRVRLFEPDVVQSLGRGALRSAGEHGAREVDAQGVTVDSTEGRSPSGVTGATADIEHAVVRAHVGGGEERVGVRGEGIVLERFTRDPRVASWTVPRPRWSIPFRRPGDPAPPPLHLRSPAWTRTLPCCR